MCVYTSSRHVYCVAVSWVLSSTFRHCFVLFIRYEINFAVTLLYLYTTFASSWSRTPFMESICNILKNCRTNSNLKGGASSFFIFKCTAGIGRMGLFSARLVHSFLCSIYGVKNDHQKNMSWLQCYVANSLVPLWPKVIKYGLKFRMWTIRNFSKFCWNSINFILNFQVEKKVP